MSNDGYGSAHREAMKKSMEEPAGQTHHPEPSSWDKFVLLILGFILLLGVGYGWFYLAYGLLVRLGR